MINELFLEIDKFKNWADSQAIANRITLYYGEWETEYECWDKIYELFKDFISNTNVKDWKQEEKEKLLYIIARDNEGEYLASILNEEALTALTQSALMKKTNKDDARDGKVSDHKVIDSNMRDAKWQLAINLYKLSDRKLAIEYLNILAKDKDEYVRRRASSELVK